MNCSVDDAEADGSWSVARTMRADNDMHEKCESYHLTKSSTPHHL